MNSGCSLLGYDYLKTSDASEAPDASDAADASDEADASDAADASVVPDASDASVDTGSKPDSGSSSDSSTDAASDASFDAAPDGSAFDASDGSRDAESESGLPDAQLDASIEEGTDASTDGGTLCDGATCAPRCNLTGTFGLQLSVPTTWTSTSQISSGSGSFEFRLRLRGTHVDNQVALDVRQCSDKTPPIHAPLANEDYLLTYPNSLFDTEVLSSVAATMTLGDSTATSSLSLPPVALEMGVALSDPLNDAWPTSATNFSDAIRVDAEGDGNPAVTGIYSNAGNYLNPRTSTTLFQPQRAQQAYMAVRWVFSMSGVLSSCDGSQGDATLVKLDSRILGCRHADGTVCTAAEANHLDTNLPKFSFSNVKYVLTRVAENATCATVRALP